MKYILIIILVATLILGFFTIPIMEVEIEDKYIYGDYFCNTYDGSCISTKGHFTLDKLTSFEYFKYKSWEK